MAQQQQQQQRQRLLRLPPQSTHISPIVVGTHAHVHACMCIKYACAQKLGGSLPKNWRVEHSKVLYTGLFGRYEAVAVQHSAQNRKAQTFNIRRSMYLAGLCRAAALRGLIRCALRKFWRTKVAELQRATGYGMCVSMYMPRI